MTGPVLRESQAARLGVEDTRQVAHSGVAGPGASRGADAVGGSNGAALTAALGRLGGITADGLNKMADLHYRNRYLAGQAKARLIESEEEIQGNPLTRDWELAGYRDTMGKLAMADMKAQFEADRGQIAAMSRQDFDAYMEKRRQDFMPAFQSMSLEQRAALAGQMALQDRADTDTWAKEHTKYIIDQKSAAVGTLWNTALRGIHTAQTQYSLGELDKAGLDAQIESAVGNLVGSVWLDGSLPRDVQAKLTAEAFGMALANDSVELYDYMSGTEIQDIGDTRSTLLSRLPRAEQDKLADQYRAAKGRTEDRRNLAFMESLATLEAQVQDGTYSGTYAGLQEFLRPMVVRGAISGERAASIYRTFLKEKKAKEDVSDLAAAAIRGDYNAIVGRGKSTADAVSAVDQLLYRTGATPEQRFDTWARMGLNGMNEGWKRVGQQAGIAFRQYMNANGEVLTQHKATIQRTLDYLTKAEAAGDINARVSVLSGMDGADRMFAERMFASINAGQSVEQAHTQALKTYEVEQKLTPSQRAALNAEGDAAVREIVADVDYQTWFGYGKNLVKGLFGDSDAIAQNKVLPYKGFNARDGYIFAAPHLKEREGILKRELSLEVNESMLAHPYASRDQHKSNALAAVAARTIDTEYGQMYIPRGQSAESLFGVRGGNLALVGRAVSDLIRVGHPDTGSAIVQFNGDRIQVYSMDKEGRPDIANSQELTPDQVRERIKQINDADDRMAEAVYGRGTTVKGAGGSVTFNGNNSAGIAAQAMYYLRSLLVEHEGVSNKAYKDSHGQSVGVGVFHTNPAYPKSAKEGKAVSKQEIDESFHQASDAAAKAASKYLEQYSIRPSPEAVALVGNLCYQSGPGVAGAGVKQLTPSMRACQKVLQSLSNGDKAAALYAIKGTAAYKMSPDKRKRMYEDLINRM